MENHARREDETPPDSFRLEELQQLQTFENQILDQVNYYFWINLTEADAPYRFLFYLELVFGDMHSLLLTSGEDTEAIRVSTADDLVKTAADLRALHDQIVIQRVAAENFPLWEEMKGRELSAIRLSKNEHGLYANDALLLVFGDRKIMVRLSRREGLEVGHFEGEP